MKPFARSDWERALLVCGKCSRKLGGGFGPKEKTPLAKALRRELGVCKGRRARIGVAEVKCLGVCPKRAVTVVDTGDLACWRLVPPGEDVAALARKLSADPERAEPARILVVKKVRKTRVVAPEPDQLPPA